MILITFSHASGSIPMQDKNFLMAKNFFPREWEYTFALIKNGHRGVLFPTRVGVYPSIKFSGMPNHSFSHASGSIPVL